MPVFVSFLLMSLAAAWLGFHLNIRRRLHDLKLRLPAAYQAALAVTPEDGGTDQLVPLSIDLMRKAHCSVPFDALTPAEQRIALYAYAVQEMPRWMLPALMMRLRGADRALIKTLRRIRSSRPVRRETHFGALDVRQRLRSAQKP